jgi:hypothetical protein
MPDRAAPDPRVLAARRLDAALRVVQAVVSL